MDLIREIERLRADGYTNHHISEKLDISDTMVSGLLSLKKAGEGRLLQAALAGKIPLWVAIGIPKADTAEMQRELPKAYEGKQLNYMSLRMSDALLKNGVCWANKIKMAREQSNQRRNDCGQLPQRN